MIKKMILLSALSVSVIFTSCTKNQRDNVRNEAIDQISKAGASVTASVLTCENEAAIKADFEKELKKLSVFQTRSEQKLLLSAQSEGGEQKVLGTICNVAAAAVVPILLGRGLNEIPQSWGCSGARVGQTVDEFTKELCSKI